MCIYVYTVYTIDGALSPRRGTELLQMPGAYYCTTLRRYSCVVVVPTVQTARLTSRNILNYLSWAIAVWSGFPKNGKNHCCPLVTDHGRCSNLTFLPISRRRGIQHTCSKINPTVCARLCIITLRLNITRIHILTYTANTINIILFLSLGQFYRQYLIANPVSISQQIHLNDRQ
ncbi:unnamed protein product [Aphis gossypii]|uniref:Uncharacterized protein n=1 Tax=Aphis gossypii TaxID=80765 RepID=A0A9P0NNW0_APHGO|nr:unnamed protein product [Aphis gossypii]